MIVDPAPLASAFEFRSHSITNAGPGRVQALPANNNRIACWFQDPLAVTISVAPDLGIPDANFYQRNNTNEALEFTFQQHGGITQFGWVILTVGGPFMVWEMLYFPERLSLE